MKLVCIGKVGTQRCPKSASNYHKFCCDHLKSTRKDYEKYKQVCSMLDERSIFNKNNTCQQFRRLYVQAGLCSSLRSSFKTKHIYASCQDHSHEKVIQLYQDLANFCEQKLSDLTQSVSIINCQEEKIINENLTELPSKVRTEAWKLEERVRMEQQEREKRAKIKQLNKERELSEQQEFKDGITVYHTDLTRLSNALCLPTKQINSDESKEILLDQIETQLYRLWDNRMKDGDISEMQLFNLFPMYSSLIIFRNLFDNMDEISQQLVRQIAITPEKVREREEVLRGKYEEEYEKDFISIDIFLQQMRLMFNICNVKTFEMIKRRVLEMEKQTRCLTSTKYWKIFEKKLYSCNISLTRDVDKQLRRAYGLHAHDNKSDQENRETCACCRFSNTINAAVTKSAQATSQ